MVEFAGWEMPIQYSGIIEEHVHVRRQCGIFDVSHMGDLLIRGPEAAKQLDWLLTNPIGKAPVGKAVYSHLLNTDGQIIDDVINYHIAEGQYLMVQNASNVDRVREWVKSNTKGLEVVDLSRRLACIAVQGPMAQEVLQRFCSIDLSTDEAFPGAFRLPVRARFRIPARPAAFEGQGSGLLHRQHRIHRRGGLRGPGGGPGRRLGCGTGS